MTLNELIAAAKQKSGTLGAVATALGISQTRISEWKKGKYKPDATAIAQLAELADLPIFQTVAEVECSMDDERARVWAKALGNLRAAGVAATVMLTLSTCLMAPNNAQAAGSNPSLSANEEGIS